MRPLPIIFLIAAAIVLSSSGPPRALTQPPMAGPECKPPRHCMIGYLQPASNLAFLNASSFISEV